MKIIGVYEIVNKLNNNRYIGSSVDITTRKRQHFDKLKKNTHGNRYLQAAFNLYGNENFVFNVLEEFEDAIDDVSLRLKEQDYINNYDWDNLYNLRRFVLASYLKVQKYCNLNQWIYHKKSNNTYQVKGEHRFFNFKSLSDAIEFRSKNWKKLEGIEQFEEYSREAHSKKLSEAGIKSGGNVSFSKVHGKWSVFIYINRKPCSLGFYNTKEEGVKARLEAEERYYEQQIPWTQAEADKYKSVKPTSNFRGVGFNKKSGKWRARVNSVHIGLFMTELEAAKAVELYIESKK